MALRLIDTRVDWLLQYAHEISTFDAGSYADIKPRLGGLAGYLQDTRLAIVPLGRSVGDWEKRGDRWRAFGDLISRVEAEFPGRILMGSEDRKRFEAEPKLLCWAVMQLDNMEMLYRSDADFDAIAGVFERGVRVFRLGGPGQLEVLAKLGSTNGPRPVAELSLLDAEQLGKALDWFDADPTHRAKVFPLLACVYGSMHDDTVSRIREMNGLVGIAPVVSAEDFEGKLKSLLAGSSGVRGIGIGTGFVGREEVPEGLGTVELIIRRLSAKFDAETARALAFGNAGGMLDHITGS